MPRYTDDVRASAVIMLEAEGYPERKGALASVAKYLKIPAMTLHRWFHAKQNPPPNALVTIKKEQIIEMLKQEVYAALQEMPNARPDADYKELATAAAILTDKWQLLDGKPTERIATEHEYTDSDRITEIEKLLDNARARASGQSPIPSDIIQ